MTLVSLDNDTGSLTSNSSLCGMFPMPLILFFSNFSLLVICSIEAHSCFECSMVDSGSFT
uniref:Uncharacterized protein n=1 Tax=Arundo donax TaxID=35708 RepID=A0A0A9BDB1_ARUDO